MTLDFEELDYQETPLGAISLRRRADPRLGGELIYEMKLGDEHLMSSLFTAAEMQLARLRIDPPPSRGSPGDTYRISRPASASSSGARLASQH